MEDGGSVRPNTGPFMSLVTLGALEPISSTNLPVGDPQRLNDIEQKHRLISELLESGGYDALLLQNPGNLSWMTSGADMSRAGSNETTASLFVTRDARVVIASNADSPQIFDRSLPGLGFQLKERPWHESRDTLVDDLCRGRAVVSDTGFGNTFDIAAQLKNMRMVPSTLERERIRALGKQVAHAVEATARHCLPGQTECEIAGELSHRLIKHRVIPERIQVWADGSAQRYSHWSYGEAAVERSCSISVVGRRWGLSAGAARTVCFGEPTKELNDAYCRATLIQATGIFFSQPDWALFEIWNRVHRIYNKFGCADEWRKTDQAEVLGYDVCEVPIVPKSEFRLAARMPVFWHPSVGPAVTGDTALVADDVPEIVTPSDDWPQLTIVVKGVTLERPNMLRRNV